MPHLPSPCSCGSGRPRLRPLRVILDAISYEVLTGFRRVLPRRWVAERAFSWIGHSQRLSNNYAHLCETIEVLIHATMSRLLVRRLARI